MAIVTRPATQEYRDNFEMTFGSKPKRNNECRIYNTECPTPDACKLRDPSAPCLVGEIADQAEKMVPVPENKGDAMNQMQQQVREFHYKFGHPVGETPAFSRQALRSDLILEEAIETAVATVGTEQAILQLEYKLAELRGAPAKAPDLVEAIDGKCDLLYVTFGAAIEEGVDLQPFFDEVHRTNMLKVGGATRADGKTLKPEGWKPPRIAQMLEKLTHVSHDDCCHYGK